MAEPRDHERAAAERIGWQIAELLRDPTDPGRGKWAHDEHCIRALATIIAEERQRAAVDGLLQVELYLQVRCTDAWVDLIREIELPAIFPGLELTGICDDADDIHTDTVTRVQYDHRSRRWMAILKPDNDPGNESTLADLKALPTYAAWRIDEIYPVPPSASVR